jgi:hypothetical protein
MKDDIAGITSAQTMKNMKGGERKRAKFRVIVALNFSLIIGHVSLEAETALLSSHDSARQ